MSVRPLYLQTKDSEAMHESDSIEQLFTTHHARLLRLAAAMLHDEEEARDAVSEVFEHLMSRPTPAAAGEWERKLLAAVRNRCIDRIRQMKVAERVRRRLPIEDAHLPTWEQKEEHERRLQAVTEAIGSELTEAQRATLQLRYQEEKSYREIAESMGISQVAVYKHLRGALERLRKKVSPL